MNSVKATLIAILILIAPMTSIAGGKFVINPIFGYSHGHTRYTLEAPGIDSESGSIYQLKSELTFPINAMMIGGQAEYLIFSNDVCTWKFVFSLKTSLNDPGKLFEDSDWYSGVTPVGSFDGQFSFTESEITLDHLDGQFRIYRQMFQSERSNLYLYAGYRYQEMKYIATGYDGWQIDIFNDAQFRQFEISNDSDIVIDYRVTYKSPHLGMLLEQTLGYTSMLNFSSTLSYMFIDDYDDHLLRGKDAVADGTGYGLSADIGYQYYIGGISQGNLFFELAGNFHYAKASTQQTQTWYVDEIYYIEGEQQVTPAGYTTSGIPHDISTIQYGFKGGFGYRF